MDENKNIQNNLEDQTPETNFKKTEDDKDKKPNNNKEEEGKNNEGNSSENKNDTENKNSDDKDEKDKKKEKKYSLDEVEEYQTLKGEYATLQRQFAILQQEKDALAAEIEPLRTFKMQAERSQKETMINSFYMLSDDDKADVVANIDKYSLDEIEAKLAVIGMRNKVNFGLSQEIEKDTAPQLEENSLLFNLQSAAESGNNDIPAWIKAVQETEKNLY